MKTSKKHLRIIAVLLLFAFTSFFMISCSQAPNSNDNTQQGAQPTVEDQKPTVEDQKPTSKPTEKESNTGLFETGSEEQIHTWKYLVTNELVVVKDTTLTKVNSKLRGDIKIPTDITAISKSAFKDCSGISGVYIGSSVHEIGDSAFIGCTGMKTLTIEGNVTKIGAKAFYGCTGLRTVAIGKGVTSIGANAFEGCTNIKYLLISNSVTSIGKNAFVGCTGIKNAYIGTSVTYIGDGAFKDCTAMEKVFMPESVSYIGSKAFYNCNILETIEYEGNNQQFQKITVGSGNDYFSESDIEYSVSGNTVFEEVLDLINNQKNK